MTFKVYGKTSEPPDEFGEHDQYRIIDGGVLDIRREDGSRLLISPSAWAMIQDSTGEPA